MPFGLGAPELIIVLVIIMVIFGGSQLPKLARSLGQAKNEFEKSAAESEKIKKSSEATTAEAKPAELTTQAQAAPAAQPAATATPVQPTAGDNVTLSKAQLDELIAKAAENQRQGGNQPPQA